MGIKSKVVGGLTLDDMRVLLNWCGWQDESLWDGMSLQEILNVYHVSNKWDTWELWAQAEGDIAREAWNAVVATHGNKMVLHGN